MHNTETDKDDINISIVNDVDVMGKDTLGNMIWIPEKSKFNLKDCNAKVKGTYSAPTTCNVDIKDPGESKHTVSTVNNPVTIKIFPNLKEIEKNNMWLSSSCATDIGELSWNYMSYKGSSKLNEVNNCVGLIFFY